MNKKFIRGLAIGFFLSGIIIFLYPEKDMASNKNLVDQKQLDQLVADKKQLQSENSQLSNEIDILSKKMNTMEHEKIEKNEDKTDPQPKIFEFEIVSGMDSKQISQLLADEKIIAHADDLNDWLTIQKLHRSIQVGTYKLTSEMSIQSIANAITK